MKTEDLQKQGLTKEQIDFVMAENGKDITDLQAKLGAAETNAEDLRKENEGLEKQMEAVQATLDSFKDVDISELQREVETMKINLQTAQNDLKIEKERYELEKNVRDFLADKQFVNDFTKNSIVTTLMSELSKDSAKGKSIHDLFAAIVNGEDGKIKPNILVDIQAQNNAAQFTQPPIGLPPAGAKLSTSDLMRLKNQYPDLDITNYI